MKKFLIAFLALALVFCATACEEDEVLDFGSQFAKTYASMDVDQISAMISDWDQSGAAKILEVDLALAEMGELTMTPVSVRKFTDPVQGNLCFRIEMRVELIYGGATHTRAHVYEAELLEDPEEGMFISGLRLNGYHYGASNVSDGAEAYIQALAQGDYLTVLGLTDRSRYEEEAWKIRRAELIAVCLHEPVAYEITEFTVDNRAAFAALSLPSGNKTVTLQFRNNGQYFYEPETDADLEIFTASV